jgi:hypothetical protein
MTYSYKKISLTGKDKIMTKFRIAKKKKKKILIKSLSLKRMSK